MARAGASAGRDPPSGPAGPALDDLHARRLERSPPPSGHAPMSVMVRPLDGVRVLDFTRVLAGPHATRALADLGADVIKVEPPDGDLTRFSHPRINGLATYFVQQNVGKRNISIDLATPRGVEVAAALADRSDVLVENYRTGVMERLGLGPTTLRTRNPRLIYVSVTGYGATGPWLHRRAYAPVVGAETGLTKAQSRRARRRLRQRSGKPCRRVHGEGGDRRRAGGAVRARADGPGRVDRRVDGRDDAVRQRAPPRSAVGRRRPRAWCGASPLATTSCSPSPTDPMSWSAAIRRSVGRSSCSFARSASSSSLTIPASPTWPTGSPTSRPCGSCCWRRR